MIDRDIVYELARKAGGVPAGGATFIAGTIDWDRFSALVAAEVGIDQWHRGFAEGQAVEREACAQVAEWEPCITHTPQRIAAAIRARGDAK